MQPAKFMTDPTEFTPKEQFHISLYKDPAALFSRSFNRSLAYLLPSVALVAYSLFTGDLSYGIMGYGILLFQAIYRLILLKRGLGTISTIVQKYEAKIQRRDAAS